MSLASDSFQPQGTPPQHDVLLPQLAQVVVQLLDLQPRLRSSAFGVGLDRSDRLRSLAAGILKFRILRIYSAPALLAWQTHTSQLAIHHIILVNLLPQGVLDDLPIRERT